MSMESKIVQRLGTAVAFTGVVVMGFMIGGGRHGGPSTVVDYTTLELSLPVKIGGAVLGVGLLVASKRVNRMAGGDGAFEGISTLSLALAILMILIALVMVL